MKFGTDGVRGVATRGTDTAGSPSGSRGRRSSRSGHELVAPNRVVDRRRHTRVDAAFAIGAHRGFAPRGRCGPISVSCPTPLVAFEAQRLWRYGSVVSASHNPYGDNGIKLFAPGGTKLTDDVEARIEASRSTSLASIRLASRPAGLGRSRRMLRPYGDTCWQVLDGRDPHGLKVVLDAANGAAVRIAPDVLRAAGAEVIVIADGPDGRNINDGCGATTPSSSQRRWWRTAPISASRSTVMPTG